jgi:hypothetical protein
MAAGRACGKEQEKFATLQQVLTGFKSCNEVENYANKC